jgi:branched-chain amino acid transport system ATP-binding protein
MFRVEGLRAGYGRLEVLHGVDLAVPEGSTVALLGANGAGKTTLLKAMAGLLPVRSGRVSLDGERVESQGIWRRARGGICLIPEGRGIFRQLSVRENLAMFVDGRNVNAAVDKAASFFPVLKERLDQEAGTLSGGEQQMVALSRALVTVPNIVLADELSVGLAPVVVDEIFSALAMMKAAGQSLLIVEQYVERVLEVADYVYILHKGQIAFVGEPDQCENAAVFEHFLGSVG